MDSLMIFQQVLALILFYKVVPSSAGFYYYCDVYNYCYYYYYYYYYYSISSSVGTIIGAVIGGIVGLVVLIVITVVLCIACNKSGSRGTVVHPMNTTTTVVSANNTNIHNPQLMNMQYQPQPFNMKYNNYNQYPPPGGSAYPPNQSMVYPPTMEAPGPANYSQPPSYPGIVPQNS